MFDQTMKTAAEAAMTQMKQAIQGFAAAPATFPVPPAMRDFAARGAESAKAGFAEAEAATRKAAAGAETLITAFAGAGADLARSAVAGAVANATMTMDAVQTVLGAPNLQDALQRQGEFMKAFGEANLARAEEALARARDVAAEGVRTIQAEAQAFAGSRAA
ncbi:hypothetical protein [Phreatobacter cathodiphilus]|uniref:Phasin n=1 Tax=Phreatobacter cathodiphilus TaxID=1868589 RepID=A0A2S0NCC3_9HYPH|nr:hypothetical protein [Phreatobacter cathodiphilus]AVO45795.1 hypothetical protein C6569_12355 [Phreatobacter cathodiphilus]